jgi:hypothetical protein
MYFGTNLERRGSQCSSNIENKQPISRVIFEDCTIEYNNKKSLERSNAKY